MHKDSLYRFVLYALLNDRRSNLCLKLEALLFGKRNASIRYFAILFSGCDIPSFLHVKKQFEEEHLDMRLPIIVEDIEKDEYGLMTGRLQNQNV